MTPFELAQRIDFSLVGPEVSRYEVEQGCELAKRLRLYAVVVKPHYVELARKVIKEGRVKIVSVVGFPHGGVTTAVKMVEARDVLQRGADEIDMVINIGALRDNDALVVKNDIAIVAKTARSHPVKVILETGFLSEEEIVRGCKLAEDAGASFVATSSGYGPGGATAEDLRIMRNTLGPTMQIKAAGITSWQIALLAVESGVARIGTTTPDRILRGE
ncbi:MAG: deoxyribose-phosphate aldolase [Chloroflexi bacterium]|nr:deoxyribose-phosphate aldolase [Chloroflexota bacterium]